MIAMKATTFRRMAIIYTIELVLCIELAHGGNIELISFRPSFDPVAIGLVSMIIMVLYC